MKNYLWNDSTFNKKENSFIWQWYIIRAYFEWKSGLLQSIAAVRVSDSDRIATNETPLIEYEWMGMINSYESGFLTIVHTSTWSATLEHGIKGKRKMK